MGEDQPGIGALAMSASASNAEPRAAAKISLIPSALTVFVAIVVTSYVASYGVTQGLFENHDDGLGRLIAYIDTAVLVTGKFGLIVLAAFMILSGITTLLGSYYFLERLFDLEINRKIAIYLVLIVSAGTASVFGLGFVFEAIDLLLLLTAGIHILAMAIFVRHGWKGYRLSDQSSGTRKPRKANT